MKQISKSEWFVLDRPLAEPNVKWSDEDGEYHIERYVYQDGAVIWFGCDTNWKKETGGNWTVLATNTDAKPLEKYLPEIVYGNDRTYWKECEMPIYEKLYLGLKSESCSCNNGIIVCPGCEGEKKSEFGVCAGCLGEGNVTCGKCGGNN